ncbi:glycosyltransferase [Arthrobacter sp. CAU 1506]|uniref:glycosyltransferase n=1 Tax=Arthrobacter sp. CAU 1506 TaxID=2560052 RepID=UPI0010AD8DB7|nr:glycosyltransferase [Arthrobacter sp. CAU 1506]TJY64062.1 glycosyltransferase [Arthrobacter sp. CAU 1506]
MTRTIHFPVNTLALKRGGLVKAVRTRANTLARHGAADQIWIEVLGLQYRLASEAAELKADGHLHPDVKVRSVLYGLDPSPEPDTREPVQPPPGGDYDVVPLGTSGLAFGYFRDGVQDYYVRFQPDGVLAAVEKLAPNRARLTREDMDQQGRLALVQHFLEASKTPTARHLIGRNGNCFLTITQHPGSPRWGRSYLFDGVPHDDGDALSFADPAELYRHAFEQLLADEDAPVLTSEFRENLNNLPGQTLDDVVSSVRHPNLRRIAAVHSNHLEPPYVVGSGVSRNWRRLLEHLDLWDGLVLHTDAQREDIAKEFGHADRLHTIGQLAPPEQPAASSPAADPNRLVMVARLHPKKRVDEAIQVFALVRAVNPQARLELFGFGYGDEEENTIRALVDELGLGTAVDFPPFTNNPADLYATACATLLTSASEGFPLILLESMSFGVPVAAYDANYGPRDVIRHGRNGFLVPFGDRQALAEGILALMRDPELRSRMAQASRETLKRFDETSYVTGWTKALTG